MRVLLSLIILAVMGLVVAFDLAQFLSLDFIKSQQTKFLEFYHSNPLLTVTLFFSVYVGLVALSIPGAVAMSLMAGVLFGVVGGVLLVSFASTVGATCAFLVSRFLLRDFVMHRFKQHVIRVNRQIAVDGAYVLFALRLAPVFPFFMINLVMGLTSIPAVTFYWVSQIGMLPGTVLYVNAGSQLGSVEHLSDIMSLKVFGSFVLIGVFPLAMKKLMGRAKSADNRQPSKKVSN